MKRTEANNSRYIARPVIKAELSGKHVRMRIVVLILLLIIAGIAFTWSLLSYLSVDAGWVAIEADSSSELNCGSEFVFLYNVGASGVSASLEKKALISLYSESVQKAFQLFNNDIIFENVNNLAYINRHPNEIIQVEDVLYRAFSLLKRYDSRNIYLAPVYTVYDNLFSCENDSQIVEYDAYQNEELRAYFLKVVPYVQRAELIDIELLEDNQIILKVSEEYLSFARDNDITNYIDFFWMKNAFIIDYLAAVMVDNQYTLGSISSYNGFVRNLDKSELPYSYQLYHRDDQTVFPAGRMQYSGPRSMVYLRDYRMTELDNQFYYECDNGDIRTALIDPLDGLCKSAVNELLFYSKDFGCAELLMKMLPVYITEEFREEALMPLAKERVYSVFCRNKAIYYNDKELSLVDLYDKDRVTYKAMYLEP